MVCAWFGWMMLLSILRILGRNLLYLAFHHPRPPPSGRPFSLYCASRILWVDCFCDNFGWLGCSVQSEDKIWLFYLKNVMRWISDLFFSLHNPDPVRVIFFLFCANSPQPKIWLFYLKNVMRWNNQILSSDWLRRLGYFTAYRFSMK